MTLEELCEAVRLLTPEERLALQALLNSLPSTPTPLRHECDACGAQWSDDNYTECPGCDEPYDA